MGVAVSSHQNFDTTRPQPNGKNLCLTDPVLIRISKTGFNPSHVTVFSGQHISWEWESVDPSGGHNVVQVTVEVRGHPPLRVPGGFASGPVSHSDTFDITLHAPGCYQFMSEGLPFNKIGTINVKSLPPRTVKVTPQGFESGFVEVNEGGSIIWQWESVPGNLRQMRYCSLHGGLIDEQQIFELDNSSSCSTQTFDTSGLYFLLQDISSDLCIVRVQQSYREINIRFLENKADPEVVKAKSGDRIWVENVHQKRKERQLSVRDEDGLLLVSSKCSLESEHRHSPLLSYCFKLPGLYTVHCVEEGGGSSLQACVLVQHRIAEHVIHVGQDGFKPELGSVHRGDRVWWMWAGDDDGSLGFTVQEEQSVTTGLSSPKKSTDCHCERSASICEAVSLSGLLVVQPDTPGLITYRLWPTGGWVPRDEFVCSLVVLSQHQEHMIHVSDQGFKPQVINIHPGDSVTWLWQGTSKQHQIQQASHQRMVIEDGFHGNSALPSPGAFRHVFTDLGVFYFTSSAIPGLCGAVVVTAGQQVRKVEVSLCGLDPDPVGVRVGDCVCWMWCTGELYCITPISSPDEIDALNRNQPVPIRRRCFARTFTKTGINHFACTAFAQDEDEPTIHASDTFINTVLVDPLPYSSRVKVSSNGFQPTQVVIAKYQSVLWTWEEAAEERHNIFHVKNPEEHQQTLVRVQGAAAFDSGPVTRRSSFFHTFDTPGTYWVTSEGARESICRVDVLGSEKRVLPPRIADGNEGGIVEPGFSVRLTCDDSDVTILYTLDGTSPREQQNGRQVYDRSHGICLDTRGLYVIRAVAQRDGWISSDVFTSRRIWVLGEDVIEEEREGEGEGTKEEELELRQEITNWKWTNCSPLISYGFVFDNIINVELALAKTVDLSLIAGFKLYLNGAVQGGWICASCPALEVSGLCAGRTYHVVVVVFPVNDEFNPQLSNELIVECPAVSTYGGPVVSLETCGRADALVIVWPAFPDTRYTVMIDGEPFGEQIEPEPEADYCRVLFESSDEGHQYTLSITMYTQGSDDPLLSNELQFSLPLPDELVNPISSMALQHSDRPPLPGQENCPDQAILTPRTEDPSNPDTDTPPQEHQGQANPEQDTRELILVTELSTSRSNVVDDEEPKGVLSDSSVGKLETIPEDKQLDVVFTPPSSPLLEIPEEQYGDGPDLNEDNEESADPYNLTTQEVLGDRQLVPEGQDYEEHFFTVPRQDSQDVQRVGDDYEKTTSSDDQTMPFIEDRNKDQQDEVAYPDAREKEHMLSNLEHDDVSGTNVSGDATLEVKDHNEVNDDRLEQLVKNVGPQNEIDIGESNIAGPISKVDSSSEREQSRERDSTTDEEEGENLLNTDKLSSHHNDFPPEHLSHGRDGVPLDTSGGDVSDVKDSCLNQSDKNTDKQPDGVDFQNEAVVNESIVHETKGRDEDEFELQNIVVNREHDKEVTEENELRENVGDVYGFGSDQSYMVDVEAKRDGAYESREHEEEEDDYVDAMDREMAEREKSLSSTGTLQRAAHVEDLSKGFSDDQDEETWDVEEKVDAIDTEKEDAGMLPFSNDEGREPTEGTTVESANCPRFADSFKDHESPDLERTIESASEDVENKKDSLYIPGQDNTRGTRNLLDASEHDQTLDQTGSSDQSTGWSSFNQDTGFSMVVSNLLAHYDVLDDPIDHDADDKDAEREVSRDDSAELNEQVAAAFSCEDHSGDAKVGEIGSDVGDGKPATAVATFDEAKDSMTQEDIPMDSSTLTSTSEFIDNSEHVTIDEDTTYPSSLSLSERWIEGTASVCERPHIERSISSFVDFEKAETENENIDVTGTHVTGEDTARNEVDGYREQGQEQTSAELQPSVKEVYPSEKKHDSETKQIVENMEATRKLSITSSDSSSYKSGSVIHTLDPAPAGSSPQVRQAVSSPDLYLATKGCNEDKVVFEWEYRGTDLKPQAVSLLVFGSKFNGEVDSNQRVPFEESVTQDVWPRDRTDYEQHCWTTRNRIIEIRGLKQRHNYRVLVLISSSEQVMMSNVVLYTMPGRPKTPLIHVTALRDQEATLSWRPVSSFGEALVVGYKVFVNGSQYGDLLPHDAVQCTLAHLQTGTKFQVNVVAVTNHSVGDSTPSSEVSLMCPDPPPPPDISNIPSSTRGAISISWAPVVMPQAQSPLGDSPVVSLSSYDVFVDGVFHGSCPLSDVSDIFMEEFVYTIQGLESNREYEVCVRSHVAPQVLDARQSKVHVCGCYGPPSNILKVYCASAPDAPQLTIVNMDTAGVTLTWEKPKEYGAIKITGYLLCVDGRIHGDILHPECQRASLSNLSLGRSITVTLTAVTGDARAINQEELANHGAEQEPEHPRYARDAMDSGVESSSSYCLERWPGTRADFSLHLTNLRPPTRYAVVVESFASHPNDENTLNPSEGINKARSEKVWFDIEPAPEPPANLHVLSSTDNSLCLAWESTSPSRPPVSHVWLNVRVNNSGGEVSQGSNAEEMVFVLPPSTTTHTVKNLKAKTQYLCSLMSVVGDGCSDKATPCGHVRTVVAWTSGVDPPRKLHVTRSTPFSLQICWEQAVTYGDLCIKHYIIHYAERRRRTSSVGIAPLPTDPQQTGVPQSSIIGLQGEITGLEPGVAYRISVEAVVGLREEYDETEEQDVEEDDRTSSVASSDTDLFGAVCLVYLLRLLIDPDSRVRAEQFEFRGRLRAVRNYILEVNGREVVRLAADKRAYTLKRCKHGMRYTCCLRVTTKPGSASGGRRAKGEEVITAVSSTDLDTDDDDDDNGSGSYPEAASDPLEVTIPRQEHPLTISVDYAPTCPTPRSFSSRGTSASQHSAPVSSSKAVSTTDPVSLSSQSPPGTSAISPPASSPSDSPSGKETTSTSDPEASVSIKTPVIKGDALSAEEIDDGCMVVMWSSSTPVRSISSYKVMWSLADEEEEEEEEYLTPSSKSYEIYPVRPRSLYDIWLKLFRLDGTSSFYGPLQCQIPGRPDSPWIWCRTVSEYRIQVEWNEPRAYGPAVISGYQVTLNGRQLGKLLSPQSRKAVVHCQPSSVYRVRLVALTADPSIGDSEPSNLLTICTPGSPEKSLVPKQRIQIRPQWTRNDCIAVEWDAVKDDIDSYVVKWSSVLSPEPQEEAVPKEQTSLVIEECKAGTRHFIAVAALDCHGKLVSKSAQLIVQTSAPLAHPRLRVRSALPAGITVDWDHPSSMGDAQVEFYEIKVDHVLCCTLDKSHMTYTTPRCLPCQTYAIQIRTVSSKEGCHSDWSDPLLVTCPGSQAPLLSRAQSSHVNTISVGWEDPVLMGDATVRHYKLYYLATDILETADSNNVLENPNTITNGPLDPSTRQHTIYDVTSAHWVLLEVVLDPEGCQSGLSKPIKVRAAVPPAPPIIAVDVEGLEERKTLEKMVCLLIQTRDRLCRKIELLQNSVVVMGAKKKEVEITKSLSSIRSVERELVRGVSDIRDKTGPVSCIIKWEQSRDDGDATITGYQAFVDGQPRGKPLASNTQVAHVQLPPSPSSHVLTVRSLTRHPVGPSEPSNHVTVRAKDFMPFVMFCYFGVHSRHARWPDVGSCSYEDALGHEVKNELKIKHRGPLGKPLPSPVCMVVDVVSLSWKPLIDTAANKPVAVLFWTKWCSSSLEGLDMFHQFAAQSGDQYNFTCCCIQSGEAATLHYESVRVMLGSQRYLQPNSRVRYVCACHAPSQRPPYWRDTRGTGEKTSAAHMLGLVGVPTLLICNQSGYMVWQGRVCARDFTDYTQQMRHVMSVATDHQCPVLDCSQCELDQQMDISDILHATHDVSTPTRDISTIERTSTSSDVESLRKRLYGPSPWHPTFMPSPPSPRTKTWGTPDVSPIRAEHRRVQSSPSSPIRTIMHRTSSPVRAIEQTFTHARGSVFPNRFSGVIGASLPSLRMHMDSPQARMENRPETSSVEYRPASSRAKKRISIEEFSP